MKIVVFTLVSIVFFVTLSEAQDEDTDYPSDDTVQYRPDSYSCKRFHEAISKSIVECVATNVLFSNMYCSYSCINGSLRLFNCHRHKGSGLNYPLCSDIFCRNASETTTCNELPFEQHIRSQDETGYQHYLHLENEAPLGLSNSFK